MLILGIGTDSRSSSYLYGLADVIRIIRVDFVNLEVSVLAIPRALHVEIPGIADPRFSAGLLNQAYFYGTEGMGYYDHPARGAGLLALTLQHNFDLTVDHYVVMNMPTFRYLVDALGGIYVNVPYNMDGRYRPSDPMLPEYYYFSGGSNYFLGEATLAYARLRIVDSIFGRQVRQSDILLALRERVLDPDVIGDIPRLIDYYYQLIKTDLSLEQVNQLFCLGQLIPEENISFVGWPAEMFETAYTREGAEYLAADFDVIRDDIANFVAGTWP
jgi:LCP family protein required for cell wall assembly